MGRPAKPIRDKLLDGTYRQDRDGTPLATKAGTPQKPDWLNDVGSKVWDRTLAELGDIQGLLTQVDADLLSLYCDAWSTFHRCRETLATEGLTTKGREGAVVKHPATVLKRQAEQTICNIGAKFGLSPQSRASLAIDAVNAIEGVRRRNHYAEADAELEDLIR